MTDLADILLHERKKSAAPQGKHRYREQFLLASGEKVNATALAKDPRNVLHLTPSTIRHRLKRDIYVSVAQLLAPRQNPAGRPNKEYKP